MRSRRVLVAAISALTIVAVPTAASALWIAAGAGSSTAMATTMPTGPVGALAAAARNVTLTWSARTLTDGTPVDGYSVTRFDASEDPQAVGGSCAGVVTALTCIDPGVPDGVYHYRITAHHASWTGAAGAASADVTIDLDAPTVGAAAIQKGAGGIGGWIRQNGAYRVFAHVDDVIGVASVTANVAAITTGQTAVPLAAGSWTVDGVTYNRRSAALTANGTLAAGTTAFSITATDVGANSSTTGFTVTVDNTAPAPSDVQTANGGGTLGKAEANDTVTFTYAESMEPISFIPSWNGAATSVTVRIVQANGAPGDRIEIWDAANTTQLTAFGTVRTGNTAHVAATVSFTGSTAVLSGVSVTITLGTPSGATGTASATGTMRWTSNAGATDRAGNACSAVAVNEQGTADIDF